MGPGPFALPVPLGATMRMIPWRKAGAFGIPNTASGLGWPCNMSGGRMARKRRAWALW